MIQLDFINSPKVLKQPVIVPTITITEDDEFIPKGIVEFTDADLDMIENTQIDSEDAAFIEFKNVYKERIPYQEIPMLDGPCYRWEDAFIDSILIAMTTDRLVQMSNDELEAWRYFVNFQNYHSTSARETDANGTAVGCTIPDSLSESFVVAGNGTIMNGIDGLKELCQNPSYEVEGEQIWKSLDKAMMSLYNCEEINSCTNSDIPEDVSPCII